MDYYGMSMEELDQFLPIETLGQAPQMLQSSLDRTRP